ncbi:MAG: DUF4389 domain-containing protein [Mariprofundaceae bacterium]
MSEDIKTHVKDTQTWMRLPFMLLFGIIYWVVEIILIAVILFQFLFKLFAGNTNDRALSLGGQLSTFVYQMLNYLTFNTEERPYPFSDWPSEKAEGEPADEPAPEPEKAEIPAEETKPETDKASEAETSGEEEGKEKKDS